MKREREYRRKKKALYFSTFNGTFYALYEQGVSMFILSWALQIT